MLEASTEVGAVEPILVDAFVTGLTVTIRIRRTVDGFFLDWSDNTFKLVGAVAQLDQTLTQVDVVNAPGLYALASVSHPTGLNTAILTNLSQTALTTLTVIPMSAGLSLNSGDLRLVPQIDGLVPARTVQSRLNAMARGKITLTGALPAASQVAEYFDETGGTAFKNDNTGDQRNPVP